MFTFFVVNENITIFIMDRRPRNGNFDKEYLKIVETL